jgi:hypothetical protein
MSEQLEVEAETAHRAWRLQAALDAQLDGVDAELFADGDGDIELLRQLVKAGVPPALIAAIVI